MHDLRVKSHLLLDLLAGCDSTAVSSCSTTWTVLVVLLVDLLVWTGSVTVSSRTAALLLLFLLVALVVLRLSARLSSSTELSARALLRVALVDLAGWETVWSAGFSSSAFFRPRPLRAFVLPGV